MLVWDVSDICDPDGPHVHTVKQSMCLIFVLVFILFQLICENHISVLYREKALFNLYGLCEFVAVRLNGWRS